MCPIPLTLMYRYENGYYTRIGTHHRITIEEYELLERQVEITALIIAGISGVALLLSVIFIISIFLTT